MNFKHYYLEQTSMLFLRGDVEYIGVTLKGTLKILVGGIPYEYIPDPNLFPGSVESMAQKFKKLLRKSTKEALQWLSGIAQLVRKG